MIVEIYSSKIEGSITVVIKGDYENGKILANDSIYLREIEGEDWNDCMSKHHELMDWEKYIPF